MAFYCSNFAASFVPLVVVQEQKSMQANACDDWQLLALKGSVSGLTENMHCKCKQELFFLLTQLSLTYWFSGWSFPVTFCYCLLITQLVLFLRCAWYTTSKQRFYHGRYSFTFYPRGSCWHSLIIFVARQQTSVKWWCWMAKCFPMLVMGLSTPIIWRTKAPICSDILDVDRYAAFMSMLNKLYLWEKIKAKDYSEAVLASIYIFDATITTTLNLDENILKPSLTYLW